MPFSLIAFAEITITASLAAILNSTTVLFSVLVAAAFLGAFLAPGFGVLFGVLLLGEPFGVGTALGLAIVLLSVALGTGAGFGRAGKKADGAAVRRGREVDRWADLRTRCRHRIGLLAFETRNPRWSTRGNRDEDRDGLFVNLETRAEEEACPSFIDAGGREVRVSRTRTYDHVARILHWTTYRRWHEAAEEHTKVTLIACAPPASRASRALAVQLSTPPPGPRARSPRAPL